ncbi:MAG: hypothetical protein ABSE73_12940 [Planctomycetota bacterium]
MMRTDLAPATLFLAALLCRAACAAAGANPCFAITVVDEETGRGVPLVELRTVNEIRYYTDSNGIVAFDEPGLLNQKVFFHVQSDGYEFPKDGFGYCGTALDVKPGAGATLRLKRLNAAERLYRITGQGIYRDSLLAGQPVPLSQPVLNAQVLGQDSVQMAEYHGKLYWFWGDTNKPAYPLGHFGTAGATSQKPGQGGLDPAKGIELAYFTDQAGFSKPTCNVAGEGMKWLDGLVTVPDETGAERLVAHFSRMKSLDKVLEHGWVVFNDKTETFEPLASWPLDDPPRWPCCHAFRHRVGEQDYVYFAWPFPHMRVKADLKSIKDPHAYEAFTPLVPGSRYVKGEAKLERSPDRHLTWGWKPDTGFITFAQQKQLFDAGQFAASELVYKLTDIQNGRAVIAHAGSVAYNAFRKRWIMVFHAEWAKPSNLGEVYYAEAEALEGPWVQAQKIVTHARYSFYNVKHHPLFDQEGGRIIYFEGTYSTTFSDTRDPTPATPRYDYNQVMYRLDLASPRLKLQK